MSANNAAAGQEAKAPTKRVRVYQVWKGNELFCCWGHCIFGPNWRSGLGSSLLIIIPSAVYCYFVAPYLAWRAHAVLLVFSIILPLACLLWLSCTACSDPGILPRQQPDAEWSGGRKPRTKEVILQNGQKVTVRYNDTCHFYQPPRAHHCSVNDNCIERFDHHCPWVGTTIGLRNYRTFLLFIFSTTVLCLYVFGCSLAALFLVHQDVLSDLNAAGAETSGSWSKTLPRMPAPAAIGLMVYSFIFFFFVGGLSGFHCYLVASNQTTYENFRYNSEGRVNPYDYGILRNCASVWCVRVPPSKVDFRAWVDAPEHMMAYDAGDGMRNGMGTNDEMAEYRSTSSMYTANSGFPTPQGSMMVNEIGLDVYGVAPQGQRVEQYAPVQQQALGHVGSPSRDAAWQGTSYEGAQGGRVGGGGNGVRQPSPRSVSPFSQVQQQQYNPGRQYVVR